MEGSFHLNAGCMEGNFCPFYYFAANDIFLKIPSIKMQLYFIPAARIGTKKSVQHFVWQVLGF